MRKLNVKLFLILVIGAAATAGGVWGLHIFQYQRIAAALLWQARRAEEAEKFDQMVRYLQRYLEFAPHDTAEAGHLGRTLAGDRFAGNLVARRQAFFLLNKVLAKDSNQPDLKRLLIKTALEIGEYSSARSNLEALSKDPATGGDPGSKERGELEGDWGRLLAAEKKPAEAIPYCRLAVLHAPSDEDSFIRLAWLLRAQPGTDAEKTKNVVEADQAVNDLVEHNATSANAHLARWRYRREFDLIELRGDKNTKKIPLAKAAAEDVDVALAQAPEDVDALIAKSDCAMLLQDRDAAYTYLQQGLKLQTTHGYHGASDQGEFELLWHLATLLLRDPDLSAHKDRMDETAQTIARIRKAGRQPAAADYLEGLLFIHQRDWARAAALLERTKPALAAQQASVDLIGQIDLGLGQCYEGLEEWPRAADAFRRALVWDPTLPQAKAGLGAAQRMLGRVDDALDNLRAAAEAGQDPGKVWLEVARLEILHQLQQDGKRDWTKANEAIDRAAQSLPKDSKEAVEPVLLRAEVLASQDNMDDAEKLLKNARTAHPDRVELWTMLADLAARRSKNESDALKILDEAEQTLHDGVELRVNRALHLAADPKTNHDALEALTRKDRSGFSVADQEKLTSGLAEAQLRAGNAASAAELLGELARAPSHRSDLRLRLTLFDLAIQQNKAEDVDKVLAEIREVEGGPGAYYGLGQALRLLYLIRTHPKEDAKANLDEAWRALDRAANLRPDWSAVELARADVAEMSGDPEGMITHLEKAVRLEEGRVSPMTLQRLVEALNQRGRYEESARLIQPLRQSLLVNSPLGLLAAGAALNTGDTARAKQLIDDAVQAGGSKNFRDLLLRARYHEAMKQDAAAREDYRLATEVAPEEAVAWLAYIQYLGNHGETATAAALIKSDVAVKVAKDRADLVVAECYEVLALGKDAGARYDDAVKANANNAVVVRAVAAYRLRTGRVQEATPLLERLANHDVPNETPADVNWARRGMAMVLSSSTDYRDFRRALELVGLKLDENGVLLSEPESSREESVENRRARARVLATQPERPFRVRAIQLLEGLQLADNEDRFLLAMLYEEDGAEAKEAEILTRLAANPDRALKPGFLTRYAQLLIRQGQNDKTKLDEAQAVVTRLEQMEKDRGAGRGEFGSVELRARLLEAQNQGDKALDLIRDYIKSRAEKKHPEEMLMLVASLGRQKRFAEAFDLCDKEKIWDVCPPEMAGGVCVALLRDMPTADEQRNRVEGWLKTAIEKNPKIVVLKMHLADLYDLRGDYKRAEGMYREIQKEEPGNVVALNNLAWLLSGQTGQGPEAMKCIEAAINGIGRRADLLDTRGLIHLNLNETEAALADFTEAANDSPTAERLFHLGWAQYKTRDRDAAQRTLSKAKADYGLLPTKLHPTEQQVCQTLLDELKVK